MAALKMHQQAVLSPWLNRRVYEVKGVHKSDKRVRSLLLLETGCKRR